MVLTSRERGGAVAGVHHIVRDWGRREEQKACRNGVWKGGGGVREDTGPCEQAAVVLLGLLWSPRERQSPAASRSPRAGRARPLQQSEGLLPTGA